MNFNDIIELNDKDIEELYNELNTTAISYSCHAYISYSTYSMCWSVWTLSYHASNSYGNDVRALCQYLCSSFCYSYTSGGCRGIYVSHNSSGCTCR